MALPKYGTSGRPVFASTGRPAFSCGVTQNCPPCTGVLSLSTQFTLRLQGFTHIAGCYVFSGGFGFNRIFISGVVVNEVDILVVAQPTLQCAHRSLNPVPTTGTVRLYAIGDNTCPSITSNTATVANVRLWVPIFRPVREPVTGATGFEMNVNFMGDVTYQGATTLDVDLGRIGGSANFLGSPSSWNCLGNTSVSGIPNSNLGFNGGTIRITRTVI